MKRTYFLAGLGLVAALAIVSPALGGPSLKSLVKEEVSKQLSNAQTSAKSKRGPRGPAGPAGPAGANGAAGAAGAAGAPGTARAYAFVDRFDCPDPGYPDDCAPLDGSKGVATVTAVSAGVYCADVPGLTPLTAPAVATPTTFQSFPGNGTNQVIASGTDDGVCPGAGVQYQFSTFDPADPTANVDTSFTFIVP